VSRSALPKKRAALNAKRVGLRDGLGSLRKRKIFGNDLLDQLDATIMIYR